MAVVGHVVDATVIRWGAAVYGYYNDDAAGCDSAGGGGGGGRQRDDTR